MDSIKVKFLTGPGASSFLREIDWVDNVEELLNKAFEILDMDFPQVYDRENCSVEEVTISPHSSTNIHQFHLTKTKSNVVYYIRFRTFSEKVRMTFLFDNNAYEFHGYTMLISEAFNLLTNNKYPKVRFFDNNKEVNRFSSTFSQKDKTIEVREK